MTDQEIEKAYEEMVERWGDKLPNPEHEPIRFRSFVTMYLYYKERENAIRPTTN
jgi:hypothetical protein